MRIVYYILFAAVFTASTGCKTEKRIKGNGNLSAETRNVSNTERIESMGSFSVEIIQGNNSSVRIEGESNLLPYIETNNHEGALRIRVRKGYNINPTRSMKIYITTPQLESVTLAGSGDVTGRGKFTGASKLDANIAGSGAISLEVNTPEINTTIAGSGDINLTGETRDLEISIAGSGNYNGQAMMAENVNIDIAGSGDVKVFADKKLDIDIAGIGNVFYKGNAIVTQSIAGSGKIKKIE